MPNTDEANARYQAIRERRKSGLSYALLAEEFGCSKATIHAALKGRPSEQAAPNARRRPRVKARVADDGAGGEQAEVDDAGEPSTGAETYRHACNILADLQTAVRDAEDDEEYGHAARLRRDMIPVLKLMQQVAPLPPEQAGILVDPVEMTEMARGAMKKLRGYAERAVDELLAEVRRLELGPDAWAVLRLLGIVAPAEEGSEDDGETR